MNPNEQQGGEKKQSAGAQTLIRGLTIIEALVEASPSIGVGELSRKVDLPKSTVQRLLRTLELEGWAETTADPVTRWRISPRLLSLAQNGASTRSVRDIALPHLTALGFATGETIHFSIGSRLDELVLIERIDSVHPVRTYNDLGATSSLHNTASGKAWLAALPPAEVEEYLARPMAAATARSITDLAVLRKQIDEARRTGYAVNRGENRVGVCAIGAAVLSGAGRPEASVAISMPESRFDPDRIAEWGAMVTATADEISRDLARERGE